MLRRGRPLCLALVLLAMGSVATAQTQLGAIQGTITDESGGVLPGVTVTVTNLATGVARTTTSNETGVYRVQGLDPGRFSITADLQGFRKAVSKEVVLSVGARPSSLRAAFSVGPW